MYNCFSVGEAQTLGALTWNIPSWPSELLNAAHVFFLFLHTLPSSAVLYYGIKLLSAPMNVPQLPR